MCLLSSGALRRDKEPIKCPSLMRVKELTELSKYIWQLKDQKKDFTISWKILTKAKSCTNLTISAVLMLRWRSSYKATPNDPTNVVSSKPCQSAQTIYISIQLQQRKRKHSNSKLRTAHQSFKKWKV